MSKSNDPETSPASVNLNFDPTRTPVLFADAVYIKSSRNGVVLDFAQQLGDSNQFSVVSRIGLSPEHTRDLIEHLEAVLRSNGTRSTQKAE